MSKVTIYMAISVDGFIAGPQNETPWSDAEWENYKAYIDRSSCLIIGRTTYDMMKGADEFDILGNPKVICVSQSLAEIEDGFHLVKSPKKALEFAAEKDWDKNIIIGGGTQLNSYFLNHNLASHLHLDIEPIAMGSGKKLFENMPAFKILELLKFDVLSSGCISVDYKIVRDNHA